MPCTLSHDASKCIAQYIPKKSPQKSPPCSCSFPCNPFLHVTRFLMRPCRERGQGLGAPGAQVQLEALHALYNICKFNKV